MNIYDKWLQWLRNEHIPFMQKTGNFIKPQIARVVGADDNDGASYSVQFTIENQEALDEWYLVQGKNFEAHCAQKFGNDVLFFTTILEVIN